MTSDFPMAGRVAVITGGGTGIGRACALRLAEVGAAVFVVGRRSQPLEETLAMVRRTGGTAEMLAVDLQQPSAADQVIETAHAAFGRLDVLVNNAGVAGPAKTLVHMDDDEWTEVLDGNLGISFRMCRAALRRMPDGGAIVNIASIAGLVGMPGLSVYGIAKAGIAALTRSIAVEFGQQGIRCNCLCPGPIDTAMSAAVLEQPAQRARLEGRIPLGRIGTPEEIADAVRFLAGKDSRYITGAVLTADGGLTSFI
jgi:3-oxoacyl-[acyl-carrier protein] reductase